MKAERMLLGALAKALPRQYADHSDETEIMPFHLRAKGMAYSVTIGQGQAIIFQYCNPIGLAKLGWKYYLVFLVFLLIQSRSPASSSPSGLLTSTQSLSFTSTLSRRQAGR